MHPQVQMNYQEFLDKLGINSKENFKKYLMENLKFYKLEKKLEILFSTEDVVNWEELYFSLNCLKEHLKLQQEINVKFKYSFVYEDNNELIEANWHNIVFLLQRIIPAIKGMTDKLSWRLENRGLTIEIEEQIIAELANKRKANIAVEDFFRREFDSGIKCIIESSSKSFDRSSYEVKKEQESTIYIEEIMKNAPTTAVSPIPIVAEKTATAKSYGKKSEALDPNSPVLLGKNFNGTLTPLIEIRGEMAQIVTEAEVIAIESRDLNSGKKLYTLTVTDYTSSIMVKIFERKNLVADFDIQVKKGQYLRIRGDVVFDKFAREYVLMASDIVAIQVQKKLDPCEVKRVELHVHTQMSSMDGVSSTSSIIKRAAEWGHKAIAITDHGVVQAFPEAMEAAKKHGIKVIYGMEGYLVNDEAKLVEGEENYSLEDEFIIFDIETTGLSNKLDRITEIGAVRIKGGKILEEYNQLINPQMPIPEKIIQLTGITNEMVANAPAIEEVLPKFISFIGAAPLVAHNASFDIGFIRENVRRFGLTIKNTVLDTLQLARVLLPNLKRHKLDIVAKELGVKLENHHRAVDDALCLANIFVKMIEMMKEKEIYTFKDINTQLSKKADYTKLDTYHIILLVQNEIGLKNLYQIVSESHINYFYKKPRIPKSLLNKYREGILLGTACEAGELYQSLLDSKPQEEIERIVEYYDYLEIQPTENNSFLIEKGLMSSLEDIQSLNRRIVELGEKLKRPVVATCDVHFLESRDEVFRKILMAGQGFTDADNQAPLYFRTTDEMLKEFTYLGPEKAKEVVIDNPVRISEGIESLIPIPDGTFPPEIEGSDEELRRLCYDKAARIYGSPLPEIVQARLDRELNSIISNGYAVMYIIAQKLVTRSLQDGYLVGSRGSVGSSFAATMSDITEVNPLPPHYVCDTCKHSEFITDGSYGSGADLPDKSCPNCEAPLIKEGHDIPFEVFLGFEGDKEPDIDLNFAGEYQSEAHKYTEELFGKGKVFRAGTIGTIADKTAYGFVKKFLDEKGISSTQAEINRLTIGCTGVKRTSGQHPGGVMIVPANKDIHEFCPIQYPANDPSSGVITTHFDYHSISGRLLKLDILGHDVPTIIKMLEDITKVNAQLIPLDDKPTVSLFTSTEALGIKAEDLGCEVGTLGIPEFGTKFVRQMLLDTQPTTFAELVRISGLSHGTDVWLNNAQDLVRAGTAELKDVISTRDDIMNYLIYKGLPKKTSFKIMENVRKGKGLAQEHIEIMKENNVPQWYIDSCNTIKYMFPKAHAVAYVMMSFRIAYFKVHHPEAFYATYFTTKAEDFDADLIVKGKDAVLRKIKELEALGNDMTAKEKNLLTVLEVALEMFLRGIYLLPVDIYESDADKFLIKEGKLLPPLKSLQGVGQNAARNIVEARKDGEFISLEDLRLRSKITKTAIETLVNHGCISDLPETNQLCLF